MSAHVVFLCRESTGYFQLSHTSFFPDDLMDSSITRRGQPCWYKKPGVGTDAVNDCTCLAVAVLLVPSQLAVDFQLHASLLMFPFSTVAQLSF